MTENHEKHEKTNNKRDNESLGEENEIFKSLSHEIRRNIIKALGEQKELSFTEIKNKFQDLDSPSLSYHLKSLRLLITQKNNLYCLTDIGKTALLLMDKIDQSQRLKTWKRNIMWSNIITIVCWTLVMFLVPFIIKSDIELNKMITIVILLNLIAQINFQSSWWFWGKSWNYNPGKRRRNH